MSKVSEKQALEAENGELRSAISDLLEEKERLERRVAELEAEGAGGDQVLVLGPHRPVAVANALSFLARFTHDPKVQWFRSAHSHMRRFELGMRRKR